MIIIMIVIIIPVIGFGISVFCLPVSGKVVDIEILVVGGKVVMSEEVSAFRFLIRWEIPFWSMYSSFSKSGNGLSFL